MYSSPSCAMPLLPPPSLYRLLLLHSPNLALGPVLDCGYNMVSRLAVSSPREGVGGALMCGTPLLPPPSLQRLVLLRLALDLVLDCGLKMISRVVVSF